MVMPGDEHFSCAHEISLWFLHTVTIASHSIDNKYVSNERRGALQKRIQGACKWLRHTQAFPVGLKYGSLAIDDDRYVFNEIGCLAHKYCDVFTIPCAFFFSYYFAPFQTCEPNLDNAPSKLLGRLVAMPVQPSPFPPVFLNNRRMTKLFHVPSTTHAALPGRTFNKNHWHVTKYLAAHYTKALF
jgi:hypothetical protein